ncbi:MAG: AI-2E family transporter [Alphaproteobacteria bacterium]|nr:MAG: AI-2E family transporter [Alphaproteobacteria bacterium]
MACAAQKSSGHRIRLVPARSSSQALFHRRDRRRALCHGGCISGPRLIAGHQAYAIYATALRLSIDQLLGPVVLGHAARLHPSVIIFCFLAGGLLFGIPGVIMAVPVALAIKVSLATIYDEPHLVPIHVSDPARPK